MKLSLVDRPILKGKYLLIQPVFEKLRIFYRTYISKTFQYDPKYFGHFVTTRSFVHGFQKKVKNFNYQPKFSELKKTVFVISNIKALKQVIEFKKKKLINKIIAGPNFDFVSIKNKKFFFSEIDYVVCNSKIHLDIVCKTAPFLKKKLIICPVGVDAKFWHCKKKRKKNTVLIYIKKPKIDQLGKDINFDLYINYLKSLDYDVEMIIYGAYNHKQFKNKLSKSLLLVVFTSFESQGIAFAEAWASDVPTAIINVPYLNIGGKKTKTSSAPYLNSKNGFFFNDFEHFKIKFKNFILNINNFTPRSWVLSNMTDEIIVKKFISLIK